jgi:hypothetical protein
MIVWAFQYTYCIYESSFETISLHKTAKGAYKAMKKHILKEYEEWRERKQMFKHGEMEDWRVIKIKILE